MDWRSENGELQEENRRGGEEEEIKGVRAKIGKEKYEYGGIVEYPLVHLDILSLSLGTAF